jgi:hypothetical protein
LLRFNESGFNDMKAVELVSGQRVKWQCVDGAKEWIGTELTFDLKPQKEFTILLFAQRGWKEPVEFMHYCSTKWAMYMLNLKSLCETGVGTPYPDDISIDIQGAGLRLAGTLARKFVQFILKQEREEQCRRLFTELEFTVLLKKSFEAISTLEGLSNRGNKTLSRGVYYTVMARIFAFV